MTFCVYFWGGKNSSSISLCTTAHKCLHFQFTPTSLVFLCCFHWWHCIIWMLAFFKDNMDVLYKRKMRKITKENKNFFVFLIFSYSKPSLNHELFFVCINKSIECKYFLIGFFFVSHLNRIILSHTHYCSLHCIFIYNQLVNEQKRGWLVFMAWHINLK